MPACWWPRELGRSPASFPNKGPSDPGHLLWKQNDSPGRTRPHPGPELHARCGKSLQAGAVPCLVASLCHLPPVSCPWCPFTVLQRSRMKCCPPCPSAQAGPSSLSPLPFLPAPLLPAPSSPPPSPPGPAPSYPRLHPRRRMRGSGPGLGGAAGGRLPPHLRCPPAGLALSPSPCTVPAFPVSAFAQEVGVGGRSERGLGQVGGPGGL